VVAISLFCVFVVPEICYAFSAIDRHYFGFFDEKEPIYAKTTANQRYYAEKGIPFVTADDIKRDYELVNFNRSLGLPVHYELKHKQHYTFTNGVKRIYNKLPSINVPVPGLSRRLQEEAPAE